MAPVEAIVSRQGDVVPFTVVEGPDAWYAKDYKDSTEWLYKLTEDDVKELELAVQANIGRAHEIQEITKEDFPLPNLSSKLDAIDLFNRLAASPELRLDMFLEPGDVQLLSNHTCLHTRTEFTDDVELDQRRHLLRLWLSPEDERPLPPVYGEILGGSVEVGNRGGIRVKEAAKTPVPLEAE